MPSSTDAIKLRALLRARLDFCKRELETLLSLLQYASTSPRLEPFSHRLQMHGINLLSEVSRMLLNLELPDDGILPDVLSDTGRIVREARFLHQRLAAPVLRHSPEDEIPLKVVLWLHDQHPRTAGIPAACTVGDMSILPVQVAPIYFMPSLEGRGLLYLALIFHEYGHLIFALYRDEMRDLIEEFQQVIESGLQQLSGRNDYYSEQHSGLSKAISERWFEWTHEFFCDAIGLHLGGAAYLHAFSSYVHFLDPYDYVAEPNDLQKSTHPLSWMRIRLLAERARRLGLGNEADDVECEWKTVLDQLQVDEDYHGYFDDSLQSHLQNTLDDMLTCADFEPTVLAFGLAPANCEEAWIIDRSLLF